MGLFSSINVAATGMSAQRLRLDVVSDNIANASTARTPEGGPFRRSRVIFRARNSQPYWRSPFLPTALDNGVGRGVRVASVQKDMDAKPKLVYDPTHPDAIQTGPKKGYVEMPNVNIVEEMVDMMSASRSYEANVAVVNGSKAMFMRALEIGR
ncbi:flagellar basal body rod protein FlgC [Sediminispirochaeta smaragdinae]|uniref:Flagellar basal-body rod protein FlgC n=1 Tax=Sediminispirochaeta smaragdinae (strain DSM 11293 / JCM 15392 / SEBR 4228) TaxID=573413 RepID=E1R5S2_SEDSS|nr:flagellar basal body rod protein FlgC [Sediminispirochaeta smaragdinae]ADK80687.1 flagellar basal-body rod protein FlgC [Sediminispirochaeta smaragdinae DSM 11293]